MLLAIGLNNIFLIPDSLFIYLSLPLSPSLPLSLSPSLPLSLSPSLSLYIYLSLSPSLPLSLSLSISLYLYLYLSLSLFGRGLFSSLLLTFTVYKNIAGSD